MLILRTPAESPTASLAQARFLLGPPKPRRASALGVLGAAAACAASALLLATAVIFGGPMRSATSPEVGENPLAGLGSVPAAQQPALSH